MPALTSCPYCDKLYTLHSLNIHRNRCANNPTVKAAARNASDKMKKKQTSKERPRTRSICRHEKVEHRLCMICADKVLPADLPEHEAACMLKWKRIALMISPRFDLLTPVPLEVPSLDGSLDFERLNQHALIQCRKAQHGRCKTCRVVISIVRAITHKCPQAEPAKTPNTASNNNVSLVPQGENEKK